MPKGIGEVTYDRMKFGTLAAVNADGANGDPASVVTITPPTSDYAIAPTAIFAQSQFTGAFSLTATLAAIWNTAPMRMVRIGRYDANDTEVVGIDYSLPQVSPRSAMLQLDSLEIAALSNNVIKGKTLKVKMDDITATEWQALYVVYKVILANDEIRV